MNQFHSSLDLYHRNKGRRATVPETPFLLLAKRIPPMYWRLFQGVTLDSRMGYTGRRQFHSLGQAIRRQLVLPTRANYTGRTLQCDIKSRLLLPSLSFSCSFHLSVRTYIRDGSAGLPPPPP